MRGSRLRLRDGLAVAFTSLRTQRLRATLTAGGIAIGIAAMVAVLGVSTSGRADLLATLDALGTNLLTARPGQSFLGAETPLHDSAPGAIRRIGPVEQAAATAALDGPFPAGSGRQRGRQPVPSRPYYRAGRGERGGGRARGQG